jgi:drug/metabolite transporter (DMT)-like permease
VTGLALGLVLASAFVHASWNFLLKKSGGGAGLITAASTLSLVLYAPLVAGVLWWQGSYAFEPTHLALMAGSGFVHMLYFLLLDRAYRSGGDLSIVYPLARATGPLLTIVAAVVLLGERPGATALGGAVLIGIAALFLAGNPFARVRPSPRPSPKGEGELQRPSPKAEGELQLPSPKAEGGNAVGFALLTGCMIAVYTLWDKQSVAAFLIPPLLYDWGTNAFRVMMLVPYARRRTPGAISKAWAEKRSAVVAIALLSPLSYILVLTAMVWTPVSLVAPAREVSILFAALMGAHLLREGDVGRRALAAVGMVLGIAGLALG